MVNFLNLCVAFVAFLSFVSAMASTSAQDTADHSPIRRRVTCSHNYHCPQYSYRVPGRDCYVSFDDCACIDHYHKSGTFCFKDLDKCNYHCPINSHRISGRDCYYDFNDCECHNGYKKYNSKCVKYN
jgi:hypothetical protein